MIKLNNIRNSSEPHGSSAASPVGAVAALSALSGIQAEET